MAEGRSTPAFHTMHPPRVGSCMSAFFQLFEWNSSKRFSLTSDRLSAGTDGSRKISRRSLKLEDHPAPSLHLLTSEGSREGFSLSENGRTTSTMAIANEKVPGVVARLMDFKSLPHGMSHTRTVEMETDSVDIRVSPFEESDVKSKSPTVLWELLRCDVETSKMSLKSKLPGFGRKTMDQWEKRDPVKDEEQKSQLWSQEQSLAPPWDIVQQQPLVERKDAKQSIVQHSPLPPCQLDPGLLSSKSQSQMLSPLRSPLANKGRARILEAAVKILEPDMQPHIHPQTSHAHQPLTCVPSILDPHNRNDTSSVGEGVSDLVASETARTVKSSSYSSTTFSNLSASKTLCSQSMSRIWNGREDSDLSSAAIDESQYNHGSVSFCESRRYDHEGRGSFDNALVTQPRSLSHPGNACLNKAVNFDSGNYLEVNGLAISKTNEASMQKFKPEVRNSLDPWSAEASERFTETSSCVANPEYLKTCEVNVQHQARLLPSVSFGKPESMVTDCPDFNKVPEPISPQFPVPSVPSIAQKHMLSGSAVSGNGGYGSCEVFVSIMPNTMLAASEFASQSPTGKWGSKEEVFTTDWQQQSPALSHAPVQKEILGPSCMPGDGKISSNAGMQAVRALWGTVAKPDKEDIFPRHRVFSTESTVRLDLSHRGPQGHCVAECLSVENQEENAFCKLAEITRMSYNKLFGVRRDGNRSPSKKTVVIPKGAETIQSVLQRQSVPHTAPPRCGAIVDTMVSVNPKVLRMKSSTSEIHHSKHIPDPIIGTRDRSIAAVVQNTAMELNGGCFTESPTDNNAARVRESMVDSANSGKLENKQFEGRLTPLHRRARSVDEVFPQLPLDSDVMASKSHTTENGVLHEFCGCKLSCQDPGMLGHRLIQCMFDKGPIPYMAPFRDRSTTTAPCDEWETDGCKVGTLTHNTTSADCDQETCPVANTLVGDASVSFPHKESTLKLFAQVLEDLHLQDEIEKWRRSLSLMGLVSENYACSSIVDSSHDLSDIGDTVCAETGGAWSMSATGCSTDCKPQVPEHALGSSNPETGEEGLSPILVNWFLERSNDSSMCVEEGQQPSPVSILDSPFHDEVSTTPETSLAELEQALDEVLELDDTCIQPSSHDVERACDALQEIKCSSSPVAQIASIRENEKICQAILAISKFQNVDLHGRSLKAQPLVQEKEQSFVHRLLRAAQLLSGSESALKWFAPSLPMDPTLFDRLESGEPEQISLGGTSVSLSQPSSQYQNGALWRCDCKLLFDSINEALVAEVDSCGKSKPWVNDIPMDSALGPGGCKLVDRVYGRICKWRDLASNAIDSLIDRDLACQLYKWSYYEQEIGDIGLEIGSMLLGQMVEEIVNDLSC